MLVAMEPVSLLGYLFCSMADSTAAAGQMERRARLRKILATMDDEDERKAALPGKS